MRLQRIGAAFLIKRGVRQGDSLSPKIFSAVFESVFRCPDCGTKGWKWEMLSYLRFTDDILVFFENAEGLKSIFRDLAIENQKKWTPKKTEILTNGEHQDKIVAK